ncbi:hypothetical protein SAMN05878503_11045 [Cereibacter ovatus]|uniref:Secreted protein n=1 Tax=Cereibacter ovatus TaxID=439529 RepID=A0A285CVH9_9RHOB|nr:hypothetical protein [Cereibacter ovatus]SNX71599.1 hypothetical protein SAMN05878503_11045 [Cereibacter ovatus]
MKFIGIPVVLASLALATATEAATVSIEQSSGAYLSASLGGMGADAWAAVDPSRSTTLPNGAAWAAGSQNWMLPSEDFAIDPATGKVDDPCGNACSPFYGGVLGAPDVSNGLTGWKEIPFFTVFAPGSGGADFNQALLAFANPQKALSLLWGSPDQSNWIELLLGGIQVANFWGAELNWFGPVVQSPGQSAALVSLSGIEFDAVRFTAFNRGGSFEFSNIDSIPAVPVPAAGLLLLSALGAVGLMRGLRLKRA